jgi:hypothetical protein
MAASFPQSGEIDPSGFPFLIVDLQRNGATGTLTVEGPTHKKQLYFRGGRVLFGSSNDPRDQLGAILIESGKLTSQQLNEATRKVGPGNPLAKVLSENSLVTQRELSDAARAKVERILADVFAYSDARYEFEDGVLPKGAVDLKLSTNRLVVAAARRAPDPLFVERHLGGSDAVLSPTAELSARLADVQSETAGLESFLDGMHNLAEAAGLAGVDEDAAGRIACGLLFLGALERASGAAPSEEQPMAVGEEPVTTIDIGDAGTVPFETAQSAGFELGAPSASPSRGRADAEETVTTSASALKITMPEPPPRRQRPEPTAAPPPPAAPGPSPLKVIAPPTAVDRTRPPTKPTQADLAALDSLLSVKAPEGPLTPLSKPTEEAWQPQFLKSGGRRHRSSNGGTLRKVLIGSAAVVTLAVGAFLVYLYLPGGVAPAQVAAVPAASAPAPQPGGAAAAPASAAPAPATSATPAGGPPGASAAPSAVTSAAPGPAPAAVAGPSPLPTPAASAAAAVPKAAAATPPTTTPAAPAKANPTAKPTPAPAAAKPAAGTPASFAAAHGRLRKGEFAEAAHEFAGGVKPGAFTVQLLLACSTDTLQKAAATVTEQDWFVVPARYKGKDCYRVCWGLYESEAAAKAGQKDVVDYFRAGGASLKVLPTAQILK